jgi:hypothetical protein
MSTQNAQHRINHKMQELRHTHIPTEVACALTSKIHTKVHREYPCTLMPRAEYLSKDHTLHYRVLSLDCLYHTVRRSVSEKARASVVFVYSVCIASVRNICDHVYKH